MGETPIERYNASVSHEQRVENGRIGGIKSGELRRKDRTMRDALKTVLAMRTPNKEQREYLEELGIDPTVLNAIVYATASQATTGSIEHVRFVRDSIGEKPTAELNMTMSTDVQSMDLSQLTDEQLTALAYDNAQSVVAQGLEDS